MLLTFLCMRPFSNCTGSPIATCGMVLAEESYGKMQTDGLVGQKDSGNKEQCKVKKQRTELGKRNLVLSS